MIKYACLAALLTCGLCHAAEVVEEDFPQFEGKEKVFLVTVRQHIHAYKSEDKLMMEKKSEKVRAINTPRVGPPPFKVKMLAQPKKKFWQDPQRKNLKYNLQLTAKRPF